MDHSPYISFIRSVQWLNEQWPKREHPRRERWPEVFMNHYGRDAPNALVLKGEAPAPGSGEAPAKPEVLVVQHQSARTVEDWSGLGTSHSFPRLEDVVRIGLFHELGVVQTTVLYQKAWFERCFVRDLQGFRAHGSLEFRQALTNRSPELIARVRQCVPEVDPLFSVLERHRGLEGYDRAALQTLVEELWANGVYAARLDGADVCAVVERSRATCARLREASEDLKMAHRMARAKHLSRTRDLGELSLHCERVRLRQANTRLDYERTFGAAEVSLAEACHRFNRASRRLGLKTQRPEVSREELEGSVAELEAAEAAALEAMRERVAEAALIPLRAALGEGTALEPEGHKRLLEESKRILRTLKFLLAPDRLAHDPGFQRLSPEKQAELTALTREIFQIRSEELGHPKGFVERDLRMPHVLEQILEQVRMILEAPELELDPWLLPPEGTLEDQIAWYEKLGRWLERELDACQQELRSLSADPRVEEQERALAGDVAAIRRDLEAKAEEFRAQAVALERELDELFGGERWAAD